MKGIVFTELLGMVASTWSEDMVDDIIEAADLPSGGAYTSVGTYDHSEIVALVGALSARTGIPGTALVSTFGQHMFGRFNVLYPDFFAGIDDAMDFLEQVETVIHVEVLKLYPDAQLPRFEVSRSTDRMQLIYRSPRHMGDLAAGLIDGCIAHYGQPIAVEREDATGGTVVFRLSRLA